MQLIDIFKQVCVALACLMATGCSSPEDADQSKTTSADSTSDGAAADSAATPGDEPDSGDDGADDGESDGETSSTDSSAGDESKSLTDDEIAKHFKDAGVEGNLRREKSALGLQILIEDGKELDRLKELFAEVPETNAIMLVYSADASLGRPDVNLAALKQLPALAELIVRDVAAPPSSIAELQGLKRLDLAGAKLSDSLLESIAKLPRLTHLNLANTTLNDAHLEKLAGMKNLLELQAQRTNVTFAGAKKLRRAVAYLDVKLSRDAALE